MTCPCGPTKASTASIGTNRTKVNGIFLGKCYLGGKGNFDCRSHSVFSSTFQLLTPNFCRSVFTWQQYSRRRSVPLRDDPELKAQTRVIDGKDLPLAAPVAFVAAGRGIGFPIVRFQIAPLAAEVLEEEMRGALSGSVQGRQGGRRGDDVAGGKQGAVRG